MSSATSDVTYTSVYTDSEPWQSFLGHPIYEYGPEAHIPEYYYHWRLWTWRFPAEEQPLPLLDSPTAGHWVYY
ncbi:hypothetical protein Tco_0267478 [Tanacetum coccineum]